MVGEINRRRLKRAFRLPEDADDAQIARGIRRSARKFRSLGRPFVLPRDLDLAGCFAAIERRLDEEDELASRLLREIADRKEKLRQLGIREMCLSAILYARDRPD